MVILTSEPDEASSSTTHPLRYDVFLSFRGEDTRKNFTDHLYAALVGAGLEVFRDKESVEKGESLSPQLELAIKGSAISVIVFSEDYASSRWCLEEVLAILEHRRSSKHHVIPIFYKVEPSDVRGQKGSFAKSFEHWDKVESDADEERKRQEKVKAWRAALHEVAGLASWVLYDEYESIFINGIVFEVEKKLDRNPLHLPQPLVRVDATVSRISSMLKEKSENASIFVIHGIGGIGKTTISKLVYNSCFKYFEGKCFVSDITENSKSSNGILDLQSQILSDIRMRQHGEKKWNIDEGTTKIQHAIQGKKVLIVLDDVTTVDQIDALLGSQRFYPGSKIIITTRYEGLLKDRKYREDEVRSIQIYGLGPDQSMELFCWHAFSQDHPLESFLKQSEDIVRYCCGNPLALKVIGSSLETNDVSVWEDSIRKLKEIPKAEFHEVLRISYDSLKDDKEKSLFLHLACFFNGYDKDFVITILDPCDLYPRDGIAKLTHRCLLFNDDNKVRMHQLIQKMGREIVRQESPDNPGERSRLWEHKDSFNVLNENMGSNKIKGFILDMDKLEKDVLIEPTESTSFECGNENDLKIDAFEIMKNLMLLQLNNVTLSGSYSKLPKSLRWLHWHGFPLKSIPREIMSHLTRLVVLEMCYSKLVSAWDGFKRMPSLKILDLSYSKDLQRTPNFKGLPSLNKLILKGCASLTEVCESVKDLKALVLMNLEDCTSLTNIPYLPRSIKTFHISNCNLQSTVALSPNIGRSASLPLLKYLSLQNCHLSEQCFPTDMSHLVSLEYLKIRFNPIIILPLCIRSIPNLKVLDVSHCSQLQYITGVPNTIQELTINANGSLQEVLLDPSTKLRMLSFYLSFNLYNVDGLFKFTLRENVEKKIIRLLGLESIDGRLLISNDYVVDDDDDDEQIVVTRTENLPIRVLYEFGIFSAILYDMQELRGCFTFRAKSNHLAFKVPSLPSDRKICCFKLCFITHCTGVDHDIRLKVEIHNTSRDINWMYIPLSSGVCPEHSKKFVWSSVWKCGDFLEVGDEVKIHINYHDKWKSGFEYEIKECGINLIYEGFMPKKQETNETKEGKRQIEECREIRTSSQLSWTDKLNVEISNYCNNGKSYLFLTHAVDAETYNLIMSNGTRQHVGGWGSGSDLIQQLSLMEDGMSILGHDVLSKKIMKPHELDLIGWSTEGLEEDEERETWEEVEGEASNGDGDMRYSNKKRKMTVDGRLYRCIDSNSGDDVALKVVDGQLYRCDDCGRSQDPLDLSQLIYSPEDYYTFVLEPRELRRFWAEPSDGTGIGGSSQDNSPESEEHKRIKKGKGVDFDLS